MNLVTTDAGLNGPLFGGKIKNFAEQSLTSYISLVLLALNLWWVTHARTNANSGSLVLSVKLTFFRNHHGASTRRKEANGQR